MGRHLDELLRRMAEDPAPSGRRRKRRYEEEPEGLVKLPRRPTSAHLENPLADPLEKIKQPLRAPNDASSRRGRVEFTPVDIIEIRYKFHATQRRFARMFGISVETLRNWEQGKRRPHGPARALLRVARANPDLVVTTLWRYRRTWWMD